MLAERAAKGAPRPRGTISAAKRQREWNPGSACVPTLVLWGKQDSLLPLSSGEKYAAGISGARLVSFDRCGHIPAVEKTEEFLSAVNSFLGGAPAAH